MVLFNCLEKVIIAHFPFNQCDDKLWLIKIIFDKPKENTLNIWHNI